MRFILLSSIIILCSLILISCSNAKLNTRQTDFLIWDISFLEKISDLYAIGENETAFFHNVTNNSKINTDFEIKRFLIINDSIKIHALNTIRQPQKLDINFSSFKNIEKIFIFDIEIPIDKLSNIYSNLEFDINILYKDGNNLLKKISHLNEKIIIPEIFEKNIILDILNSQKKPSTFNILSEYDKKLAELSYNIKNEESFDINLLLTTDYMLSPNNINWKKDFFTQKNEFYEFLISDLN